MELKKYHKPCINCNRQIIWERGNKPLICPFCSEKYWDKPEDERNLFQLQDTYIDSPTQENLGKLYLSVYTYSRNIVKHLIKNKVFLQDHEIEEKAQDTSTMLIEKFLNDPYYRIDHSFGGMLIRIAQGVLYKGREEDIPSSLESVISEGQSTLDDALFILQSTEEEWKPFTELIENQAHNMSKMIESIVDYIHQSVLQRGASQVEAMLVLEGLGHFFYKHHKQFYFDFYTMSGNRVKRIIEISKLLVWRAIKIAQMEHTHMENSKLFQEPIEVFEAQLNDIFDSQKSKDNDKIIQLVSFILYENSRNRDMIDLFNLLGLEKFVEVTSLFEKREVRFPSKEEIQESVILALVYYYRESENLSWKEIKDLIPFEVQAQSYSRKVKSLNHFIQEQMRELILGEEHGEKED